MRWGARKISVRRELHERLVGPAPVRLQRTCGERRCVSPRHVGIRPPPPPFKNIERALARALRRQGLTLAAIAEVLEVRVASVHRWVHEAPIAPLPTNGPWRERAACLGTPTSAFFDDAHVAACLALCTTCAVAEDCAAYAKATGVEGVWAGAVLRPGQR